VSAVELAGVEVAYDGKPVVRAIDLDVPVGGWLGLIGPNGSGKTTILRAIAGLVPHRGRIALCGTEVAELGAKQLARLVAIVRQEPSLPAGMSLAQYVLLGRSSYFSYLGKETRQDREIVAGMLERLSLSGLANRPLDSLSGGERQRAAIARALVQQAPILLVDEPTSALDVGRQQDVLDLIDGVRRDQGLTVVAAMHDLTLAGQYAERLALIVGGRLVECGAPADILTEAAVAEHYSARVRVRAVNDSVRAVVPDRTMAQPDPHTVPSTAPRPAKVKAQSVVIVNTGDGKGKSTAAFGTVMRAAARGWKVCVIQFVKSGKWKVGEETSARRLGVEWWAVGDGFSWDSKDMDRSEAVARQGWRAAREKLASGDYGLVVLDEITYPMNWGWIPVSDVVEAIRSRPPSVNVITTGRDAPEELVEVADTVTEMRNRKHAFDRGIRAIRGIDF
jgi:cob(I)alamin adenosyltransferase